MSQHPIQPWEPQRPEDFLAAGLLFIWIGIGLAFIDTLFQQ
jgi:hypothetical protein